MAELPDTPEARLALLQRGFQHGVQIQALAAVGEPAYRLRDYVREHDDLSLHDEPDGFTIDFADRVIWEASVDGAGIVRGLGSSGFGPLMEALGIDFSGRPYAAGD